jgi:capsular exopolysaccharide synthesis family protein
MHMQKTLANGGRSSSPAGFSEQVQRYKRLLAACWWVLILSTGVALGVGWMLLKNMPPSFLSIGRMSLNVKLAIPNASFYTEELYNFFGTQVELMQSSTIQDRVSERLRTQSSTLHPCQVRFLVTVMPKANIFNLRAEGTEPDFVHAYLQVTMEEYVKLKRELLENASSATTASLEKERDLMGLQLQESKQEVFNYQSSNSVVFLQKSGGNDAADYLATLNRQLTERKSELQLLQTLTLDENLERQRLAFSQPPSSDQPVQQPRGARQNPTNTTGDGVTPSAGAPMEPNADDNQSVANANGLAYRLPGAAGVADGFEAAYLQAKQQIVLLKAHKQELSEYMRPKHPDIIAVDDEIARQQRLLAIFQAQSREQLTNHQHVVEAQIKDLENEVKEWESKAVYASKKLSEFEALKANANRLQSLYDQLQATLQTLGVNKGIGQESVAIFEPATPALPMASKLPLYLAMSGISGFVLGLGILLLRAQLDDRPGSLSELENLLGEPVLGQIPYLKVKDKKMGVPLIQMEDDRHMLVESYSNLRSALLFKEASPGHSKSIVVTSAVPGDGKSMVCANLAITLAHAGARVLLVDADLRRGQMHRRFSIPDHPGLAEVLAEKCAWSEVVVHTSVPNLDLLPRGEPPLRPSSLLISRTKKLLEQMTGHYDYYLFDSAPVLAADDVSSLAPQVDGVLMVVRAGSTNGRFAKSAMDLLYLRKVNVIGLVFNAVSPNAREYIYHQYHEYFTEAPTQS